MRIDSGAAPLSLALLQALSSQAAPAAAGAHKSAAPVAGAHKPAAPVQPAAGLSSAPPEDAPAAAGKLPRGSFVDLRV